MKTPFSKEMIKKNREIKKANLKMEKNIDEVIKHFELEDNVRKFLDNAISKQKSYAPVLNKIAREIINKEILKVLEIEILKLLIENAVTDVVTRIAYKEFEQTREELKQDFIDKLNNNFDED